MTILVNQSDISDKGINPSFSFDGGVCDCLIVKVAQDPDVSTNPGQGADTVTYNGVALTKFPNELRDNVQTMHQIWGLQNAPQGTGTLALTSVLSQSLIVGVESYSGVSTTATFPNISNGAQHFLGSGSLSDIRVEVTTTEDDCVLVGLGGYRGPAITSMTAGDTTTTISSLSGLDLSFQSNPLATGVAGTYHLEGLTGGGSGSIVISLLVVGLTPGPLAVASNGNFFPFHDF